MACLGESGDPGLRAGLFWCARDVIRDGIYFSRVSNMGLN